jgi:hypothetical protein
MKAERVKIETPLVIEFGVKISKIEESVQKVVQIEDNNDDCNDDNNEDNDDDNNREVGDGNAFKVFTIDDKITHEKAQSEKRNFVCFDFTVGIFFVVVFLSGLVSGVINGFLFLRLTQLGMYSFLYD